MSHFRIFIFLLLSALALPARSLELTIPSIHSSLPLESFWLAMDAGPGFGSTAIQVDEQRRVFLAFQADLLLRFSRDGELIEARQYRDYRWQATAFDGLQLHWGDAAVQLALPVSREIDRVRALQWFTLEPTGGIAPLKKYATRRTDEVYLPFYYELNAAGDWVRRGRFGAVDARPVIYQMLPRLFGNENETRKVNGTLAENGSGKFSDLSEPVLATLRRDGFSHIWLTGLLQQATSSDYSEIGQHADDPDLLKGIAGSPYAIRDYFDVSPDYADRPEQRLQEFQALTARMHAAGMKVVIDFVPNHVARSYASDIRPELAFGVNDRKGVYFDPDNNFYYLTAEVAAGEAPLRLPTVDPKTGQLVNETARIVGHADGYFTPEKIHGRVTGNNVVSWRPTSGDWYETIKLNYGFDFLNHDATPQYPTAVSPRARIPDTWQKMDAIIAYWQQLGVDGFRADMAHMVPPEFWKWMIHRARERDPAVLFFAEAYNDDPAKVPGHDPAISQEDSVMLALLDAGFHAVYDDPGYDTLEHLYAGKAWANDLQSVERDLGAFFFDCALRYAENHDEIRLAHPATWGGLGMEAGRPVTATLFGLSRGAVMLYHGQEVGEPGLGREGFGGDDQRSTIFDYWSLPELNKWWNAGAADGGLLSAEQAALRAWYVRLLRLQSEPALSRGNTFLLNEVNRDNPFYGKVADVGASGHWFFAYLRSDPETQSNFLITSNFHANATLRHLRVRLSQAAVAALGLSPQNRDWLLLRDRLADEGMPPRAIRVADALREGIYLDSLAPQSTNYWSIEITDTPPSYAISSPSVAVGKPYLGAPPLLRAQAGAELRIDLRRFGNPGASHVFRVGSNAAVEARIDAVNHVLHLKLSEHASGLHLLPLFLEPRVTDGPRIISSLPIAIAALTTQTFRIDGLEQAQSVALVGEFNDWNDSTHRLQRVDGGWAVNTAFKPGRYLYKYVIDGQWQPDPRPGDRFADGYGGWNSFIQIEGERGADHPPATLFVESIDPHSLQLRANKKLLTVHAEALPASGGVIALDAELADSRIRLSLRGVEPGSLIRVLAEDVEGKVGLPVIAYAGEPSEDVWRDDIIYYAFTDRFYDGDRNNTQQVENAAVLPPANYQGGDFQGIEQKLKEGYFEELGVNVLWLAPLNQNPAGAWQEYLAPFRHYTGYHGYWPVDRFAVEKRFGGESALEELIEAAHGDGMKVLADLVLKHVHVENPIRKERPELFGQLELSDGSRNLRRWDDKPYTTWFEPFLPAFDFRNPETVEFLLEDATHWIEAFNLDGYRLDAVKHIRPDFWWRFRTRMRDTFPNENFYFVGETFQDRQGISDFVGPNMLDGQFDFPLYDVLLPCFAQAQLGFDQLEAALRDSEEIYGRTVRMSALLGNHDKSRFMAYADGDLPNQQYVDDEEAGWAQRIVVNHAASYDKLKLAMTFLLTIDGVPMIYYGDEIGMTGAGDPDNRRMMRFGQDVSGQESDVKAHFSKLAKARRAHPALYLGSRRVLAASADHYAYLRKHGADAALVAFNRAQESQRYVLDLAPELMDTSLRDVLSGSLLSVRNGRVVFELEPMQSAVFTIEKGMDVD
ncbi:alpha-amylase family glycosyl hydrolase [Coraliomargarita sp. SDUM461003]|uniref:Alpha-amylase family glycosyl hydrolase n=2 Tax=Thalassobacterium maritimum TaxID=3041265 RepID=A0ABU1APD6_9BACT|nr:alpha-amylase family glycosyl hydrolase [Coraliomargarita sp. SDUM461003]